MDNTLGIRRKKSRPERIVVGDETFERNDITAKRYGGSERTINRGDRDGEPFRFFNGIKYRPMKRYERLCPEHHPRTQTAAALMTTNYSTAGDNRGAAAMTDVQTCEHQPGDDLGWYKTMGVFQMFRCKKCGRLLQYASDGTFVGTYEGTQGPPPDAA